MSAENCCTCGATFRAEEMLREDYDGEIVFFCPTCQADTKAIAAEMASRIRQKIDTAIFRLKHPIVFDA